MDTYLEKLDKDVFDVILFNVGIGTGLKLKRVSKKLRKFVGKRYDSSNFWNNCLERIGKEPVSDNPRGLYEFYLVLKNKGLGYASFLLENNPNHRIAYAESLTYDSKIEIIQNERSLSEDPYNQESRSSPKLLKLVAKSLLSTFVLGDDKSDFEDIISLAAEGEKEKSLYEILKPLADRYPSEILDMSDLRKYMKNPTPKGKTSLRIFPEAYIYPHFYDLLKESTVKVFKKFSNEDLWKIVTSTSRYDEIFEENASLFVKGLDRETLEEYKDWVQNDKRPIAKSLRVLLLLFSDKDSDLEKVYNFLQESKASVDSFPNLNIYQLKNKLLSFGKASRLFNDDNFLSDETFGYYRDNYLFVDGELEPTKIAKMIGYVEIDDNFLSYLSADNLGLSSLSKNKIISLMTIIDGRLGVKTSREYCDFLRSCKISFDDVVLYLTQDSDFARKLIPDRIVSLLFCTINDGEIEEIQKAIKERLIETGKWPGSKVVRK